MFSFSSSEIQAQDKVGDSKRLIVFKWFGFRNGVRWLFSWTMEPPLPASFATTGSVLPGHVLRQCVRPRSAQRPHLPSGSRGETTHYKFSSISQNGIPEHPFSICDRHHTWGDHVGLVDCIVVWTQTCSSQTDSKMFRYNTTRPLYTPSHAL